MKQKYTSTVEAIILMISLALSACSTSRHISIAQSNVDSTSIHIRDSMIRVQEHIVESYNRAIEEMTKAGVTFEDCPPCMNRDSVLNLLDSAGRTRYKLIEQEAKIRDLNRKVKILADGSIEAEGPIKAAMMSKSRTDAELRTMERLYDSLHRENDNLTTRLQTSQKATVKRKTSRPWLPWGLLVLVAIWYAYREYRAYRFRQFIFKDI